MPCSASFVHVGDMPDLPGGIGWTALLVARARANESRRDDRLFEDPLAQAFVQAGGEALAAAERTLPGGDQREVNRWREDSIAIRTAFLDRVLIEAVGAGCRQAVIVAAGLDTRAFRLSWPSGSQVFEVDMPDVLAFKERVLEEVGASPRCERIMVAADLREPDWPERLRTAGFQPDAPSAWLMEGLLMYLAEEDRNRLVGAVGRLSCPGSRLGLDHRSGFFAVPTLPGMQLAQTPADHSAAPSLTEPRAWLARHGWRAEVRQPAELFEAYGRPLPPPLQPQAKGAALAWLGSARRT
jgi:methyltransferase (TIGR00027 family)